MVSKNKINKKRKYKNKLIHHHPFVRIKKKFIKKKRNNIFNIFSKMLCVLILIQIFQIFLTFT